MANAVTPFFAVARNGHTFDIAAQSYLRQGGSDRYLTPIIAYFNGREVETIAPAEVRQMAIDMMLGC